MVRNLKNAWHFLSSIPAPIIYRFPARAMTIIGVTGTDGKTTTTHLIYHMLRTAGYPVSMISTVAAVINGISYDTGFHVTTPTAWILQRLLKKARDSGSRYVVIEVTSHALSQWRTVGCSIDIGVVTNINHEHLDYHGTLENYKSAKAKLLRNVAYSVINRDDISFEFLEKRAQGTIVTYAIHSKATVTPRNCTLHPAYPGRFNLYNGLATAAVGRILKVPEQVIKRSIANSPGIPGRMETLPLKTPFRVIIDFAHKPNALSAALTAGRQMTKGRLIAVFGCAGLRDTLKRPMMGTIAAELADDIVLTAEDPRTENVNDIIQEIGKGFVGHSIRPASLRTIPLRNKGKHYWWEIPDRQKAIEFTLTKIAKKGDTVMLFGKGHEQSMCFGTTEYPWDEKRAVEKALYGDRA
jgi:UDP-N-acetylmuramoyl-L-alanyl-D-glutamate--2,6-diaminopimelate ligase